MGKRGLLFIISGPAGTGKGSIIHRVRELAPFDFSVSATTRAPRPGEIEGVHYYFTDREAFEKKIENGEMLEHAEYVNNLYGTPKAPVEATLEAGRDIILDIEVQGALQVKEKMPDAVMIYIMPPDFETLLSRIRGRGTETEEVIEKRMKQARAELAYFDRYDYILINQTDGIDAAAAELLAIVSAEKNRTSRNREIAKKFFEN